jgi:CMP-N,N'-diacetyllegionaminic acid synthase
MTQPRILAVIPARGGSKGIPRKNVAVVGGKPLLAYTIAAAKAASHLLYRTIVSTDDEEIAVIAVKNGVEVPFLRPADLASDRTPMVPVLQHAARFVEEQDQVRLDWILLLQPTTPLRTAEDIAIAIELAAQSRCTSIISVVQVFSTHPILMKRIEEGRLVPFCVEEKEGTRRQDYHPPAYIRNGAIYLTRRDTLLEHASIWGDAICPYIMPEERSINIDSWMDMKLFELMVHDIQES